MKLFYPTIILCAGLILTSILGCHEKSIAISQPNKTQVHIKHAKPGAAVKLTSASIVFINVNEPTQVELLLDIKEPSGTLNLELSPTNGLNLVNTKMIQSIRLPVTTSIKIPVELHAITDGRYYLNIHVGVDDGGSLSTRNLALIVQVGPEQEKSGQIKKTSGDKVISLPAQETISNE